VCGGEDGLGAAPGDFGPVTMPLEQALQFIARESFFWINA
jgi:hypothetical protein